MTKGMHTLRHYPRFFRVISRPFCVHRISGLLNQRRHLSQLTWLMLIDYWITFHCKDDELGVATPVLRALGVRHTVDDDLMTKNPEN